MSLIRKRLNLDLLLNVATAICCRIDVDVNADVAVARFDFSWGGSEYHQETLDNLKAAVKSTKKLCAVCSFFFSFTFNTLY